MERKQVQATPAGRVSQQQKPIGGDAMRKYLWSTVDASGKLVPYVVLEVSEEIAEEIESRDGYENRWMFIADRLHERYPEDFPSWFDEFGRRKSYWFNNILEDWNEAYERLVEEWVKVLEEYYDDEEALLEVAKIRAEEELSALPVVKL